MNHCFFALCCDYVRCVPCPGQDPPVNNKLYVNVDILPASTKIFLYNNRCYTINPADTPVALPPGATVLKTELWETLDFANCGDCLGRSPPPPPPPPPPPGTSPPPPPWGSGEPDHWFIANLVTSCRPLPGDFDLPAEVWVKYIGPGAAFEPTTTVYIQVGPFTREPTGPEDTGPFKYWACYELTLSYNGFVNTWLTEPTAGADIPEGEYLVSDKYDWAWTGPGPYDGEFFPPVFDTPCCTFTPPPPPPPSTQPSIYLPGVLCAGQAAFLSTSRPWVIADNMATHTIVKRFGGRCWYFDKSHPRSKEIPNNGVLLDANADVESCAACIYGKLAVLCSDQTNAGMAPTVWCPVVPTGVSWFRLKGFCYSVDSASAGVPYPQGALVHYPKASFLSCADCICGTAYDGIGIQAHFCVGQNASLWQEIWVEQGFIPDFDIAFEYMGGCFYLIVADTPRPIPDSAIILQPPSQFSGCEGCITQVPPTSPPPPPSGNPCNWVLYQAIYEPGVGWNGPFTASTIEVAHENPFGDEDTPIGEWFGPPNPEEPCRVSFIVKWCGGDDPGPPDAPVDIPAGCVQCDDCSACPSLHVTTNDTAYGTNTTVTPLAIDSACEVGFGETYASGNLFVSWECVDGESVITVVDQGDTFGEAVFVGPTLAGGCPSLVHGDYTKISDTTGKNMQLTGLSA